MAAVPAGQSIFRQPHRLVRGRRFPLVGPLPIRLASGLRRPAKHLARRAWGMSYNSPLALFSRLFARLGLFSAPRSDRPMQTLCSVVLLALLATEPPAVRSADTAPPGLTPQKNVPRNPGTQKPGRQKVEERYSDGSVRLSSEVRRLPSGQMVNHGLEIAFYQGGKHARETHFVDGKKEGATIEWYPNGQKRLEGNYHNDLKDGPEILSTMAGKKYLETNYSAGERNGLLVRWRENEHQELEQHYVQDLLEGVERRWHANGQLVLECTWHHGKKDGTEQRWSASGEPQFEAHYRAGKRDGLLREWFAGGKQLKLEAHYKLGLLDGPTSNWSDDGLQRSYADYSQGELNGTAKEWHKGDQHTLAADLHWRHGRPEGLQTYWHTNGQKRLEVTYKAGQKEGAWSEWYDNGKSRAQGFYLADKPDGKFSFWYDDGTPWAIQHYAKGIEIGKWSEWDREGHLLPSDFRGAVSAKVD